MQRTCSIFADLLGGGARSHGSLGNGEPAEFVAARAAMVRDQLVARDITDPRVLEAMASVPRHEFVPEEVRAEAYADRPLPVGFGQTISQPYVVAYMMQELQVRRGSRVLDVGTGSGYQAAVLVALGAEVYGVEIVPELARAAARHPRLSGVTLSHRDGSEGWGEHAPFDRIVVAAAAPVLPERLRQQLAMGGRLMMPVGPNERQRLVLVVRERDGFREQTLIPVCFVPMTGGARSSV